MKHNHLAKKFVGGALSLSLLFGGATMLLPQRTHAAAVSTTSLADQIIRTGEQFMGARYQYGAPAGQTGEFDCSSFVQYVYRQNGIQLPRSSRQQSTAGTYVARSDLQPGDLIFFYSPIHHVAIYMGNGKILHTYGSPGVTISDLNSGWWSSHYTTARRVLPSNGQATAPSTYSSGSVANLPVPHTNVQNGQNTQISSNAYIVRSVRFHAAPSRYSARIRYLHKGETIQIVEKVNGYWYKAVDAQGEVGYVTTLNRYVKAT